MAKATKPGKKRITAPKRPRTQLTGRPRVVRGAPKTARRKASVARPELRRARAAPPAAVVRADVRRKAYVISYDMVNTEPANVPSNPQYGLRVLAEGDSLFTMGAVPATNLLLELRFTLDAIIVNAAYPGDTIRHMSEISDNLPLRKMLVERKFAYEWDVSLVSGGGNDLIDAALSLITTPASGAAASPDPRDYVDAGRLAALIEDIQNEYRHIAALRESSEVAANRDLPIIVHRYDFPTPRNAPARFVGVPVRGPWLDRALNRADILDPAMRQAISDYLLHALGDGIAVLQNGLDPIKNFHVVDTLDTLDRADPAATGSSGDWQNEIHPNAAGYRKLGEKVAAAIESLLVTQA